LWRVELAITGLRLLAASRNVVLAAEGYGKHKTISQITAILAILVLMSYQEWGAFGRVVFGFSIFGKPWVEWFAPISIWVSVIFDLHLGCALLVEKSPPLPAGHVGVNRCRCWLFGLLKGFGSAHPDSPWHIWVCPWVGLVLRFSCARTIFGFISSAPLLALARRFGFPVLPKKCWEKGPEFGGHRRKSQRCLFVFWAGSDASGVVTTLCLCQNPFLRQPRGIARSSFSSSFAFSTSQAMAHPLQPIARGRLGNHVDDFLAAAYVLVLSLILLWLF